VIFAVFVCALAVHAAAVRLMFAVARDNNLPLAQALAHVTPRTRAPIVPAVVIGALASAILILNVNLPHVIEMLCSVAIVWANLAYLMVTFPLFLTRLRRKDGGVTHLIGWDLDFRRDGAAGSHAKHRPYFSLGRLGLPINAIAVMWGLFVVINIGWPRPSIYGAGGLSRFGAPLATIALIVTGATYFLLFQRKRTGILAKHAAESPLSAKSPVGSNASGDTARHSPPATRSLAASHHADIAGHGQAASTKTAESGTTA
jgi:amino acid transporter